MTNGHLHLRRFVAPARMINHRLHSSRFIVRGKRGANSRLATVGPGRRAVLNTGTHSRMAQSPEIGRFAYSRLANCVGGCYR